MHLQRITGNRLMLSFTKTRTCEAQPEIPLLLHPQTLLLYATGEQVDKLAEHWRRQNPHGTAAELEQYLLGSFVATPNVVQQYLERGASHGHAVEPAHRDP
jgi:hypothetical protein